MCGQSPAIWVVCADVSVSMKSRQQTIGLLDDQSSAHPCIGTGSASSCRIALIQAEKQAPFPSWRRLPRGMYARTRDNYREPSMRVLPSSGVYDRERNYILRSGRFALGKK